MSMATAGNRRTAPFLFGGAGVISAVAALATAALVFTGGSQMDSTAAPEPPEPPTATAAWSQSPASVALASALDAGPAGWEKDGQLQRNVSAPAPYSCPLPGIAPATSVTQSYKAGGTNIRVTAQAFTAGLGAEAMVLQSSNAPVCAGGSSGLYLTGVVDGQPGTEVESAAVSRGGVRSQVTVFRRGDVLVFVMGQDSSRVMDLANVMDRHLDTKLDGVCVNEDSAVGDGRRSPFSTSGYSRYETDTEVAIPEVKMPAAPKKADGSEVEKTALPAAVLVKDPVQQADVPEYPVAPAMPEFKEFPKAPEAPAAKATTVSAVKVPADDRQGPGCGWAFTGMSAPMFNKDAAAAESARIVAAEKTRLEKAAGAWKQSVASYWSTYDEYKAAAAEYTAYANEVTKVNAAWDRIAEQWDDYRNRLKEFEDKTAERRDFLERRDAAAKDFAAATAKCTAETKAAEEKAKADKEKADEAAEDLTKNPVDGALPQHPAVTPSPSPSTTVQPCTVTRPEILDEPVPAEPSRPSEPAPPAAQG